MHASASSPSRTLLRCAACAATFPDTHPAPECDRCGALLDVVHPEPPERGAALARRFAARRGALAGPDASGVWRYRELVLPGATEPVTFPEGNTPLVDAARVARWTGLGRLRLKHEGMNPTGSFKDRGMTVGITQARRIGARAVACASTGNTGASLAAYAALADLPALVIIPAGRVALGKLTQALAYGARTLLVRGDFDDCLRLVREASARLGVHLLNSVNPFRIEGQKTIVLEMLEQLGWEPPDWIAVPAGNLGNTSAFGKALVEARDAGLIDRLPRLLAVQAAGAAPFALSYHERFATRHRVTPNTVATAIAIGDPASHDRAVRAIRDTDGMVVAVSDEEILEAKAVVDAAGVGCEPASAASVAGVRALARRGVIAPDASVVAVLTGHVLKDPGILVRYHREMEPPPPGANRPREVDATLDAVAEALGEV
ncbi:MAG TPA: threonine synthase [Gemmatimonadaceae bacterium]